MTTGTRKAVAIMLLSFFCMSCGSIMSDLLSSEAEYDISQAINHAKPSSKMSKRQRTENQRQAEQLKKEGKCPACKGAGKTPDGRYDCVRCNGTGKYTDNK